MEKDWLGQEYDVGDWILYSRGYGSGGSQIVLAEVLAVNPSTVVAKIIKGSRSTYKPQTLVDTRTGKRIRYGKLHIKKPSHYRHKETKEEISWAQVPGYHNPERQNYEYVSDEYWEYAVMRPARTVFAIKANVTKVDKNSIKLED